MRTLALPPMNPVAIERANERLRQAAEGRIDPVVAEAALERARHQVESIAETAALLEATLPDRVGEAVQAGLREQVLPVARHLAVAHRQDELEAAALAGHGLQLDLAAERCRELTGDREPEAGALAVARPERPEDPLLLLGGDARPIVLDRNADRPVYLRERDS